MNIDELRKRRMDLHNRTTKTLDNMHTIALESKRVADVAHNSRSILDNLEKEFESQTGLNGTDIKFLFVATALQCVRQYWLTSDKFRFESDQQADRTIKKYLPIELSGPVPYDAFKFSNKDLFYENTGISGANHRHSVLGHDPLLGWIFGTANILTETVTKKDLLLNSYNTELIGGEYKIAGITNIITVFENSYQRVQDDYTTLALAVAKHATHLAADAFTTMGLPVPIINNVVSPNLSSTLLKNGMDIYGIGRAMAVASLINLIVAAVHGLFYDETKYSSRAIYEVKTRKILSYSNLIASASNIIYVALSTAFGDKTAIRKLDIGGIIVTIYRLISDAKFIRQVKEEFVFGSFYKMIQGEEYNF